MDTSLLKHLVKDNTVKFEFYRAGHLYYNIEHNGETYQFPVPVEDVGDATFNKTDKAILFMRYIRKAIEQRSLVKIQ